MNFERGCQTGNRQVSWGSIKNDSPTCGRKERNGVHIRTGDTRCSVVEGALGQASESVTTLPENLYASCKKSTK